MRAGMLPGEGEGLGDLGIPRRQRGSRRRLSFDRMTHKPVYERPSIERRTSNIYDLIDAIGLLGKHHKSIFCCNKQEGSQAVTSHSLFICKWNCELRLCWRHFQADLFATEVFALQFQSLAERMAAPSLMLACRRVQTHKACQSRCLLIQTKCAVAAVDIIWYFIYAEAFAWQYRHCLTLVLYVPLTPILYVCRCTEHASCPVR